MIITLRRLKSKLKKIFNLFKATIPRKVSNYCIEVNLKDKNFLISNFHSKREASNFLNYYKKRYKELEVYGLKISLEKISKKYKINENTPIFDQFGIKKRQFNQEILDLHEEKYMLGKVLRYIRPGSNVIDIGGNTGMYASLFAKKAGTVFSFEVVPPVFLELLRTSNIHKNINPQLLGISSKEETLEVYADLNRLSNSGFSPLITESIKYTKFKVNTRKIDSFNFENVSLLKIDTEGTELDILRGCKNMIKINNPACLVECYPKFCSYDIGEIYKFFIEIGYTKCLINIKGFDLINIQSLEEFLIIANSPDMQQIHDCDFLFLNK